MGIRIGWRFQFLGWVAPAEADFGASHAQGLQHGLLPPAGPFVVGLAVHKDLHSGCRRQAQPGQKRPLEVVVVVEVRGLNARRIGAVSAKALAGFAAGRRSLATVRVTICVCWLPR